MSKESAEDEHEGLVRTKDARPLKLPGTKRLGSTGLLWLWTACGCVVWSVGWFNTADRSQRSRIHEYQREDRGTLVNIINLTAFSGHVDR